MRTSKYNLVVPFKGKYIHYNMLTKSILLSEEAAIDPNIPSYYENGFLVDDSADELKASESALLTEQSCNTHLLLTIVPTLNCNLDCTYCYQHDIHSPQESMSDKIMQGVFTEIAHDNELRSVHVEWNGGEPLLEMELIRKFSSSLVVFCQQKGITYSASISTNLFALDDSKLNDLVASNVTSIDTTLAGTSSVHDKYRLVRGGKVGSFNKVWNNIIKALQVIPVSVCINVTADSEPDTYHLIDHLAEINNDKLSISFLLVEDYGFGEKGMFLEKDIHFPVMLRLLEYAVKKGLKAEVNSNFGDKFVFCAAQLKKSYLIHPSGRIYKCANDNSIENSIGVVTENGFLLSKQFTPCNPYFDSKCRSCDILPYCNGGCFFARQNGKDYCPHEKNYLPELLKLYVSSTFRTA
jgi:uncharacterized protein